MNVASAVTDWLTTDDDNQAQLDAKRRADAAEKRQRAQLAEERAKNAAAAQAFSEWQAQIDARTVAADADELAKAQARIDAAIGDAERIGEQLSQQRGALLRAELKSADDLLTASLDDLAKLARGRSAASDELRALVAVVAELERRHGVALAAIDVARRKLGELRTRGLAALADELAAAIVVDAGALAADMRELIKLQGLIAARGGSSAGRVPALSEVERRLTNMCAFYARDMGR